MQPKHNRAFVFSHLGLGDMYWMNGAVRYLRTKYADVDVVCKTRFEEPVRSMYRDDPHIHILPIEDDYVLEPFPTIKPQIEAKGVDVYTCGVHTPNPRIYEFPYCFYDDFGIPRSARSECFYIQPSSAGQEMYELIKNTLALLGNSAGYIVLHQEASHTIIDAASQLDKEKYLLLDLNKNLYPADHPYHFLAQQVVNKPLINHIQLMENAAEIHMIESSVYCLASHLDLSRVLVKKCYKPFDNSAERIGVFSTGLLPEDKMVPRVAGAAAIK